MIVARSAGAGRCTSHRGCTPAIIASHCRASAAGDIGKAITGICAGIASRISSQLSSLPANNSRTPACSRTYRAVSAFMVGYKGTEMCPVIQIARSAMIQCALFFPRMAMLLPCGSCSD
ncbi:hypothetical protein D9M71_715470 [compost metagenome]